MNQTFKITTFHTVMSNATAQCMWAAILAFQNNLRVAVIESSFNENIAFCFDEKQKQLAVDSVRYFKTASKLIALVVFGHVNTS